MFAKLKKYGNRPHRNQREFGAIIEDRALTYLKHQGMKLRTRNYHCRHGEIDLIMQDGEFIVFVEVRYRKQSGHGSGFESVDYNKQQKIYKTALHYLQKEKLFEKAPCRFDVIAANQSDKNSNSLNKPPSSELHWLPNAFQV